VNAASLRLLGPAFPWGTLIVNVAGSFVMGLLIVWFSLREPVAPALRAFLTVGVLGAFTTFSTFSLDVVTLVRDKAILEAGLYMAASVSVAIGALFAGMALARALF
ncbi:MAG: CrcB family protein, partial [Pseudomonadota bacterium]